MLEIGAVVVERPDAVRACDAVLNVMPVAKPVKLKLEPTLGAFANAATVNVVRPYELIAIFVNAVDEAAVY